MREKANEIDKKELDFECLIYHILSSCNYAQFKVQSPYFCPAKKRRTVSSWTRIYLPYIAELVNSGQMLSVDVF